MAREGGPGARAIAWLSARSMRIAGAVMASLAVAVMVLSVTTGYGLTTGTAPVANATVTHGGSLTLGSFTLGSLVAFALSHPAYPVAVALGLALFALGDDVPLLGT